MYATALMRIIAQLVIKGNHMEQDTSGFGKFIECKRKESKITLRAMALKLNIAPAYLSDIEKGRRYPPERLFDDLSKILQLSRDERLEMLDLAASARENQVSADIAGYVMEEDLARVALRRAKQRKLSPEQWQKVIKAIDES